MLCGCHHQNGIADGEIIKACRRLDCRIQVIAGQENAIAVGFVNRASDFLLERPDKDGIAVGGRDLGQGRAPCTRADYANSHAFTPAPRAFSAPGSSGQRGRAATSSPSVNPAANRSAPAQPIMAALSVRSEEHTSELQSLMRISYAVFCLKKKKQQNKCSK